MSYDWTKFLVLYPGKEVYGRGIQPGNGVKAGRTYKLNFSIYKPGSYEGCKASGIHQVLNTFLFIPFVPMVGEAYYNAATKQVETATTELTYNTIYVPLKFSPKYKPLEITEQTTEPPEELHSKISDNYYALMGL